MFRKSVAEKQFVESMCMLKSPRTTTLERVGNRAVNGSENSIVKETVFVLGVQKMSITVCVILI